MTTNILNPEGSNDDPTPPQPPLLPPLRTFVVTRVPLFGSPVTVEAHNYEFGSDNLINFFEVVLVWHEGQWHPTQRLRRAFAGGTWSEIEEVMVVSVPESRLVS